METKRNLFHKRDHPALRKLYNEWNKVTDSALLLKRDRSSLEYKEWNPFNDWCNSLEEFNSSKHKIPKSEMSKANMFFELSPLAHLIRDKLEEAKATAQENQSLIRHNFAWQNKYDELQSQLSAKREMRVENDLSVKHKLEKEVNLQKTLEFQNKNLELQLKMKEEELKQALAKCKDLVNKLSDYEDQLGKYQVIGDQANIKNDIILGPGLNVSPCLPFGQLENEKEDGLLDPDSLKVIVKLLGKVNSMNVFDWLYTFEVLKKVSVWSRKDYKQILLACLEPSIFTSILPILKKRHIIWPDIWKRIVENYFPELDNILDNEKMREDDIVLQYFQRMWMIYFCTEWHNDPTRDDPNFLKTILEGLLPHLRERVKYDDLTFFFEGYETIECAALSAEYSWLQSEDKRQNTYKMTQKAGPGCPSRMSIWKRLEKYLHVVPYEQIINAPYWKLVVYLSRYEDLQTMEPRV